jgi:anti-anti-sigma factor
MPIQHTVKTVGTHEPIRVLSLEGRLDGDSETVRNLKEALDAVLQSNTPAVVDLAQVSYISSAGWQVFIVKARDCLENDSCLRVAGMQSLVHGVFAMLGLWEIIDAHFTVDEAIAAVLGAPMLS